MIQAKEAVSSVLSPFVGHSGYERHGQRVVEGQRRMQAVSDPFLGWAPFAERDVYEQFEADRRDTMNIEEYWERSEPIEEAYYQEFRRHALDRLRLVEGQE